MTTARRNPILVTGSHRSGSSWVGKTICLSPHVGYINEPFNLDHTPRVCRTRFNHWFTYVCSENEAAYSSAIDDCIHFRYPYSAAFESCTSMRDIAKLARDASQFAWHKMHGRRALVKDPIALFSAEWLATRFDMDVIMLIRHPAAFVGSLKDSQWTHPFSHFVEQPLLMEQHLSGYRDVIEEYAREEKPVIDQAILLWNLIHHMITIFQDTHPEWTFVKHEDLSRDPITEFQAIYRKLGLIFSTRIESAIRASTTADKSRHLKRDSKSNIWSWKKRLNEDEIEQVREGTQKIASRYYSDNDW